MRMTNTWLHQQQHAANGALIYVESVEQAKEEHKQAADLVSEMKQLSFTSSGHSSITAA